MTIRKLLAGGVIGLALAACVGVAADGAVGQDATNGNIHIGGVAAGTGLLATTNGDIHVGEATNGDIVIGSTAKTGDVHVGSATGDPDDGGQIPAATTGDIHIGNGG